MGCVCSSCSVIMSSRPLVSFVWVCFCGLFIIFFHGFCLFVLHLYDASFAGHMSYDLTVHKVGYKTLHITCAY